MAQKATQRNIFSALKDVIKQRKDEQHLKQLLREQHTRVEDLYKKSHSAGAVTLPIMNAPCFAVMKRIWGEDLAQLDYQDNVMHLGAMVWLVEHQADTDPSIMELSNEEVIKAGCLRALGIPEIHFWDYVLCFDEQFMAIKKKELSTMERVKQLTETESQSFASVLANGSAKVGSTITES